jgi:hypothetical protein
MLRESCDALSAAVRFADTELGFKINNLPTAIQLDPVNAEGVRSAHLQIRGDRPHT